MSLNRNQIPSLQSAMLVLETLAKGPRSTSELALRTDTTTSTCYRILKTLEARDWVLARTSGGFEISLGLLQLLKPLAALERFLEQVQPQLDELAHRFEVTVKLSIRRDDEQLTVASGQPNVPLSVLAQVGVPYPVVQASSGAALLAGLPDDEWQAIASRAAPQDWRHDTYEILEERIGQCRREGMIENFGFNPMGLDSIATPVHAQGRYLALSIIGFHDQLAHARIPEMKEALAATRQSLEEGGDRSCTAAS